MSAVNIRICDQPPIPCSHLPTRRPNSETTLSRITAAELTTGVYHAALVNVAPIGARRYARFVAITTPNTAITAIEYAHRFHAVRNPRNLPSPSVAH